MLVCPVPKISQVMMKWCRRASYLGRFTLWNNGRRATQLGERFGRFIKHRSIVDLQQTLKYMYALRRFSTVLKDERFTKTE